MATAPAHPRRPSSTAAASSTGAASSTAAAIPAVPPAPPPPPAPPLRYNNAFAKFIAQPFAYAARPPAQHQDHDHGPDPWPRASVPRIVGPLSSQNATHRTGLEISALDVSPDGTRAILAGREILKTVLVQGTKCAEEFNLLSAMRQYASHNPVRTRPKDALDIHDVKWSHHAFDTLIATAASSGKVVLYDINRPGVELARLHEHPRQVHKVAFNPHYGALLLSGSQDGTTKLWDMRDLRRSVGVCPSQYTHNGQSDGVRDVKWSPTDGVEFAFGTDSGIVQRWDYRQPKAPGLKINAHNRTCHAIDWHRDGTHLVSAGADKTLRVWNFASDVRRQKPAWTLQAPHPVLHVCWRPPCRSSEVQGVWQSTHLVTSYDRDHPAVHVWDFRRPNVPFRELLHYNAAPTDLLWHCQDLLWTVGREGVFNQIDIKFAPKPAERRNPQAFAVASHGELTCVSSGPPRKRKPMSKQDGPEGIRVNTTPKGLSPEKASFGRSSTDDSIDEGFLSSSFKKRHTRSNSNRSAKSLSNTPPSHEDGIRIKPLDATLPRNVANHPTQIAGRCSAAAGISNPLLFTLLAHVYISSLPEDNNTGLVLSSVSKVLEGNFVHAKRSGLHRIAQSFKALNRCLAQIPAFLSTNTKQLRDEDRFNSQLVAPLPLTLAAEKQDEQSATEKALIGASKQGVITASSSNAATPLARPHVGSIRLDSTATVALPDLNKDANIILPPSLIEPPLIGINSAVAPNPTISRAAKAPFDVRVWENGGNHDGQRTLIGDWQMQPKGPLSLEPPSGSQGLDVRLPVLDRHDSNESWPMFSASTDSHRNSIPSSSSSAFSQNYNSPDAKQNTDKAVVARSEDASVLKEELRTVGPVSLAKTEVFHAAVMAMSGIDENVLRMSPKSSDMASSDINHSMQMSSVLSSTTSTGEILQHPVKLRAAASSDSGLQKRQTVAFALESSHNSYASNNSLISASGNNSSPVSAAQISTQEYHSSSNITSQNLSALKSLPNTSLSKSPDNLLSVAGLMLSQLMSYHTNLYPDAQTIAHLLLLLVPLLAEEQHSLTPQLQASGQPDGTGLSELTIGRHHDKLEKLGISTLHVESIMITYHDQLLSLRLFNTAAQFRRLCFPLYPSVYEPYRARTQVSFLCQFCKTPVGFLSRSTRCSFCKSRQSPCPICWSDHSPFETSSVTRDRRRRRSRSRDASILSDRQYSQPMIMDALRPVGPLNKAFAIHFATKKPRPPTRPPPPERTTSQLQARPGDYRATRSRLYTACTLCNHSAHASCHHAWITRGSDGGCPTPGCLCDCAQGSWRDAKMEMREQRTDWYRTGAVRGDRWGVKESKAVAMVRGALGSGGSARGEDGRKVRVMDPSVG
ncbi:MAG: SEA (Seh1-associated) complex subunit [Bathelium mastoideum]|nr:MAG: SEA (Seh1-associated) complex subunit [Bathelium mastoideum]KAI9692598.1 MAG: SEA (Seh1-associated) complex subunit [Bathelium mastoideum]